MRVYHFIPLEYGLDDLRKRRLKIALIGDLNDPFELRAFRAPDQQTRGAFEKVRTNIATKQGMLCFSRSWNNPVQWSHYAERHRGICLGFDISDEFLTPVTYASRRIKPDLDVLTGRGADALALMQMMFTTKYSHWRYEKEIRAFVSLSEKDPETGLYFYNFDDHLVLKEVIVGHSCDVSRSALRSALGELAETVKSFKARLAFGSFKVVRQMREDLWA